MDQRIEVRTETTMSVRPGFTTQHLWTARRAAWLSSQREQHLVDIDYRNVDREHRAHVTTAVFSSVAFVEALVNDAVDRQGLQINSRPNPIHNAQEALRASGRQPLDIGRDPGQSFNVVRHLRNALLHYVPEWEHDFINGDLYADLERRLRGRENRQQVVDPWFPNRALGAGCADWAVTTSLDFAKQWHTAMNLSPDFDTIYFNGNEPSVEQPLP